MSKTSLHLSSCICQSDCSVIIEFYILEIVKVFFVLRTQNCILHTHLHGHDGIFQTVYYLVIIQIYILFLGFIF